MKHLWEVDHASYCNDGDYYSNGCIFESKSWADFHDAMSATDLDYTLLFRFDWRDTESWGATDYTGDDYYRNGKLHLYFVHQHKGRFIARIVDVCRADEPAVIEFLKPRMEYLFALWEPLKE